MKFDIKTTSEPAPVEDEAEELPGNGSLGKAGDTKKDIECSLRKVKLNNLYPKIYYLEHHKFIHQIG